MEMRTIVMSRTYSELIKIPTFKERFEYLSLKGQVGVETFGFDRWMNQQLYRSREWKRVRDQIIVRDSGCDLGILGREICNGIIIHHMNPLTQDDIRESTRNLFDPEFLICTSFDTHQAIHYGNADLLITEPVARQPFDTCPWKKQ